MDAPVKILFVMEMVLIPVAFAITIALSRKTTFRVIRILAYAAALLLICGLSLHQSFISLAISERNGTPYVWMSTTAQILIDAGNVAFGVAAYVGLVRTAQRAQWQWFVALITGIVLNNLLTAALETPLRVLTLYAAWQRLLAAGGSDFYPRYYLLVSILLAATALIPLSYVIVRQRLQAKLPPNLQPQPIDPGATLA
ncbi:MAG: hypothetical protein OJF49_003597 [Ktedonobacterales bacterium]|jgi:hypothetical protein|nr:MAG: hypothetical protein OJF49_003597 [Ktedonobacterales bacterium]